METTKQKIINYLSYTFFFAVLIYAFVGIFTFFNLEDLPRDSARVMATSKSLSNFIIFYSIFLFVKKRVSLFSAALILMLSILCGELMVFEGVIYQTLYKYDLIDHSKNPQFPKFYFTLACIPFTSIIFFKSQRTLDRFFFFTAFFVVVITSFIFHMTTAMGSLQDIDHFFIKQHRKVLKNNYLHFKKECEEIEDLCIVENKVINSDDKHLVKEIEAFLLTNYHFGNKMFRYKDLSRNYILTTADVDHGDTFYQAGILSLWDYDYLKNKQILYFYFMSLCVQTVWTFIALSLSLFHRRKPLQWLRRQFLFPTEG